MCLCFIGCKRADGKKKKKKQRGVLTSLTGSFKESSAAPVAERGQVPQSYHMAQATDINTDRVIGQCLHGVLPLTSNGYGSEVDRKTWSVSAEMVTGLVLCDFSRQSFCLIRLFSGIPYGTTGKPRSKATSALHKGTCFCQLLSHAFSHSYTFTLSSLWVYGSGHLKLW